MSLIEAEIILNILVFLYWYFFYCHICCLGSFMEDLLYSVKIRESILLSYFTRHLQRLVKFWHRRKKREVDSASKLRQQSVSWNYCFNLYSLRRLKGMAAKKFAQIYLRLPVFGKCLKRVFQVCLRSFLVGRYSLEVKKIIKVKFFWIIAATAGRFYEWESSWKNTQGMFFVVPWV